MAASVPSIEVGGKMQDSNFVMSDPFLDIDDFATSAEDHSSNVPESIIGFKDFKEEDFDFRVRTRWRRLSSISTGLLGDYVPATMRIVVSMAVESAENILEHDSGLSMDQAANYHASTAFPTDTSGIIDGVVVEMKLIDCADSTRFINRENQSRMVSVLSFDVDSKVDYYNNAGGRTGCGYYVMVSEDILTELPEISNGFSDYTEEFDFKQRTRWRRPSFITDLLENN
eukprot:CAMPEP_0201709798 /NCGR_PEP_ID=MMETSP0578-20130828/58293_1 /ASSEMBLY_ACC=CAM_ASM_000663 /TAXON_ID=267565 /ORGANISM="Skeletonema grethea, Strain CCMP 1804" /LENGTH=227 /DNA_ID=CAMNT_0048198791 /DNA_START=652 /DNA_END=1332 /DNA_ORIENTATION=-